MHSIAIIGSGPTAIYTVHYLLMQGEPLDITIFEAHAEAGKGTPYHQDWNEKEMLSNIASIEIPPVTQTLVEWLESQSDNTLSVLGIPREKINDREFYPRVALGEYFKAQLQALQRNARQSGSTLEIRPLHKVLDVRVVENGVSLDILEKGEKKHERLFDHVVMATGHAWPTQTEVKPGYFLSPWPASSLRTIAHCHVGIRGTSLSAIDALVALSVARGAFLRNAQGKLQYHAEPGTEAFRATIMSRKGILPEADFYHPIPYAPLTLCTAPAVDALIASVPRGGLLDAVFALFKSELAVCDKDYARAMSLDALTLEGFSYIYFKEREEHDPFVWAERNLAEAKADHERAFTVPWRYAILRMHEVIARIVPRLMAEDFKRFNRYFKPIFVDDYATVPHESIERLLALHRAGKLDILRLGEEYKLDTNTPASGAIVQLHGERIHFPAFIEATGQRPLSVHEFPFKSLWRQGIVGQATAPYLAYATPGQLQRKPADVGGIELDLAYHPVSDSPLASRLYCLSLPFMLGQFPFAQGITSSHDMGKQVALDMIQQITEESLPANSMAASGQSMSASSPY